MFLQANLEEETTRKVGLKVQNVQEIVSFPTGHSSHYCTCTIRSQVVLLLLLLIDLV
jgi:hypothetical protein